MEKPEITGKWKRPKKDQILIGILAGILLLVIALPQGSKKQETGTGPAILEEGYGGETDETARLEQKLQRILEQVAGVGRVRVMLTVKASGKKTVEKDISVTQEVSGAGEGEGNQAERREETTVFERDSQGNERPFVTEETAPQIQGVLVAAQGGDNLTVAENIAEAAEVLFGVEVHKIKVMKLN